MVWLPTGITVCAFIANAAYIKGVFGTKLDEHAQDIKDLKENVVYKDTCSATTEGIRGRVQRLELTANGNLK